MRQETIYIEENELILYKMNTLVVGSGAAGLNAACRLHGLGQTDVVLATEGMNMGTSRNTGSDKQTYYKLSLAGSEPDSVHEMAASMYAGGCVDGEHALAEAALSTQAFFHLVELGMPFPRNAYGEFVGYKTDHDPKQRASSVGPYTSRLMTELLETELRQRGIPVFDGFQLIELLTEGGRLYGALFLDKRATNVCGRLRCALVFCKNCILATGGPAGIYADSVYPESQCGASGTAFRAGVAGRNLTEWQYGLASVRPRWNVSGSYMQALPRFISTRPDGSQPEEFLCRAFADRGEMLSQIFLKGYQWPFDSAKAAAGSSRIDLLVYRERMAGRRVWLDFTRNTEGAALAPECLSAEARSYLERAGACFGTPIERLRRLNEPAIDFYLDKGIDLTRELLEISLCAQHNNGGLAVDGWWQTNIGGLFCVGEAAGTHGICRPGGSALNAGQVGGIRAAQYIVARAAGEPEGRAVFERLAALAWRRAYRLALGALRAPGECATCQKLWNETGLRMSRRAAAVRSRAGILEALREAETLEWRLHKMEAPGQDSGEERSVSAVQIAGVQELSLLYRLRDVLAAQRQYLTSMLDYMDAGGGSRGSALYAACEEEAVEPVLILRDCQTGADMGGRVQELCRQPDGTISCRWRAVHALPEPDDFFENVWRAYREHQNIG